MRIVFGLILLLVFATNLRAEDIVQYLQDVSVTVKSSGGEGSGVIITRELKDGDKTVAVNFVWTAAHVVDGLRTTRTVIDPIRGTSKQLVEFKDAAILKEIVEDGRRVGEIKMDAKVIKYSDADFGQDLALLMVRKRDHLKSSAKFVLDKDIIPIGTDLIHVGSLQGQFGSNSMTTGIISQVGRTLDTGKTAIYDQTTATAFPGSSGGGLFLKSDGRYVGMLVRGAGETFNLIVPIRRMRKWTEDVGLEWAVDESKPVPSLKDLEKIPVEDIGKGPASSSERADSNGPGGNAPHANNEYKFWFKKAGE
jgi:S1-C subfamily serine protease